MLFHAEHNENTRQQSLRKLKMYIVLIRTILIRSKLINGSMIKSTASDRLLQTLSPVQNTRLRLVVESLSYNSRLDSTRIFLDGYPPFSHHRRISKPIFVLFRRRVTHTPISKLPHLPQWIIPLASGCETKVHFPTTHSPKSSLRIAT